MHARLAALGAASALALAPALALAQQFPSVPGPGGSYLPPTPTIAVNPACVNAGPNGATGAGLVGLTYGGVVCGSAGGSSVGGTVTTGPGSTTTEANSAAILTAAQAGATAANQAATLAVPGASSSKAQGVQGVVGGVPQAVSGTSSALTQAGPNPQAPALVVGGSVADGQAPGSYSNPVAGIDTGGLKRTVATNALGQITLDPASTISTKATTPSYTVLPAASSASGPAVGPVQSGSYLWDTRGTFGGATTTLKALGADGAPATVAMQTAPGTACVVLTSPQGSSTANVQDVVTGAGGSTSLTSTLTYAPQGCAGSTSLQPTSDTGGASNNAPFQGERALAVGTADSVGPGRSIKAVCTAAGNVSLTYADGSTGVWGAAVGTNTFPVAATTINSGPSGCAYANLK